LLFTFGLAPMYFVESYHLAIQMAIGVFFWVYTTWFAGTYWKRAPIPGVDFDDKIKDKRVKRKLMLRQPRYSKVFPKWLCEFVDEPSLTKKKIVRRVRNSLRRMKNYNQKFRDFEQRDSAHRSKLVRKPMQKSKSQPIRDRIRKSLLMTPQSILKRPGLAKQKSEPKKLTFDSFIEEESYESSILAAQVAYRDSKKRAREMSQNTLLKNLASMSMHMSDSPSDRSEDDNSMNENPLRAQIATLLADNMKKDPATLAVLIQRLMEENSEKEFFARMQKRFSTDKKGLPMNSMAEIAV